MRSSTSKHHPGLTCKRFVYILGLLTVFQNLFAQPVVTSFSPASGTLGTIVTITGSHFSAVPSNNIVFFGSVKAVVSAASNTSLTVTVPAGASYEPIAVTNNGFVGFSSRRFRVTFDGYADVTTNSFTAKTDFESGNGAYRMKISDLDGDGKPDVIVSDFLGSSISVHKNITAPDRVSFAPYADYGTGNNPSGLVIADFNGDGKPDVATGNYGSHTISVLRNTSVNGTISFAEKQEYAAGLNASGIASGDLDNDGKPDIVVTNTADNTISIFSNTSSAGNISFATRVNFGTGDNPDGVAIDDLDGDGKADIVVSNKMSASVSVFKNTTTAGSISFAAKTDYTTGNGPWNVLIADIDGDNKPDICTPNHYGYSFSILKNTSLTGAISFAGKSDFSTGVYGASSMSINDINGDGRPDIGMTINTEDSVLIFIQSGSRSNISFSSNVNFGTGRYSDPEDVVLNDLDGDGKPEIVYASSEVKTISVYKNLIRSQVNRITGYVFEDINTNGVKDGSEPYANDVRISSSKGTGTDEIFSIPHSGYYINHVDTGDYTTTITPYRQYYTVVPASHSSSFTSYNATDSLNVALQPIPGIKDLAVSIIPVVTCRPGMPVEYKLHYQNKGTSEISNAVVAFVVPLQLIYDSASPRQSATIADTIKWNLSTLAPRTEGTILLHLVVKKPPVLNLGDIVRSKASITHPGNDTTPADNYFELRQIVTSSFDPNDITESHAGRITPSQVLQGEYLQYTIRFQNTGNDTAFNISIKDTLSQKLDWNTLEMVNASSDYQLSIEEGKCEWTFNNVKLVDSLHNEPASHGYLVYRVKPKANVRVGDALFNKAAIYFDFNLPVLTNIDTTVVVAQVLPLQLLAFTAIKDRQNNLLQWQTSDEINLDKFEIERSGNGKDFKSIGSVKAGLNKYDFADKEAFKGLNYYRLKMINRDGRSEYSPVEMLNNSGSFFMNIYPNPVKDRLQVEIVSEKRAALQVKVLTVDGKVMLTNEWTVNEGTTIEKINTSSLQSGSYYLQITSRGIQQSVVRFEKM